MPIRSSERTRFLIVLAVAVAITIGIYLPVLHADFVWDDALNFEDRAWLYHGDDWKRYIFTGFNDWDGYFRPLVVLLFVIQTRLFDAAPGPMHAVTLGMHIVNMVLITLVARRLAAERSDAPMPLLPALAALAYGLHPMIVECVTWIGCQFDQVQVMTALGAIWASLVVRPPWLRGLLVGGLFFLSACAKESAAGLPVIIFLFDWMRLGKNSGGVARRFVALVRAQAPTYLALLVGGAAYLALRQHHVGNSLERIPLHMLVPDFARLDEIAYVYLTYWRVILGIPIDLNPIHAIDRYTFGVDPAMAALRVAGMFGLLAAGVACLLRQRPATGTAILGATAYLLPVLGILPIRFDGSLYHERYAIGAIALCACLIPSLVSEWRASFQRLRSARLVVIVLAACWLVSGALNVRATIPLWSNDLPLWSWAIRSNPESTIAQANYIGSLMEAGRDDEARTAIERVDAGELACASCFSNGLILAVRHGDEQLAERMIERLRDSPDLLRKRGLAVNYLRSVGHLELRKGNVGDAIGLLRATLEMDAMDSLAHMLLAEALVRAGRPEEAAAESDAAISFAHPAQREEARIVRDHILAGERVFGLPMVAARSSVEAEGQ